MNPSEPQQFTKLNMCVNLATSSCRGPDRIHPLPTICDEHHGYMNPCEHGLMTDPRYLAIGCYRYFSQVAIDTRHRKQYEQSLGK